MNECLHTWSTDFVHPQEFKFLTMTEPNQTLPNQMETSWVVLYWPVVYTAVADRVNQAKVVQLNSVLRG